VTVWLSLALGLIQIVNIIMSKLDEAQKKQVWEATAKTELGKTAHEQIAKAQAASASVVLDPGGLRAPDPDSTT
jgi:hypothetical protein